MTPARKVTTELTRIYEKLLKSRGLSFAFLNSENKPILVNPGSKSKLVTKVGENIMKSYNDFIFEKNGLKKVINDVIKTYNISEVEYNRRIPHPLKTQYRYNNFNTKSIEPKKTEVMAYVNKSEFYSAKDCLLIMAKEYFKSKNYDLKVLRVSTAPIAEDITLYNSNGDVVVQKCLNSYVRLKELETFINGALKILKLPVKGFLDLYLEEYQNDPKFKNFRFNYTPSPRIKTIETINASTETIPKFPAKTIIKRRNINCFDSNILKACIELLKNTPFTLTMTSYLIEDTKEYFECAKITRNENLVFKKFIKDKFYNAQYRTLLFKILLITKQTKKDFIDVYAKLFGKNTEIPIKLNKGILSFRNRNILNVNDHTNPNLFDKMFYCENTTKGVKEYSETFISYTSIPDNKENITIKDNKETENIVTNNTTMNEETKYLFIIFKHRDITHSFEINELPFIVKDDINQISNEIETLIKQGSNLVIRDTIFTAQILSNCIITLRK